MKQFVFVSLLLCLFLSVACTRGTEPTTHAAREERTLSDSDLKTMVQAKFDSDPQLRNANLSVSADADKNMVTLSGTVESETLRSRALELAKSAHPGMVVEDKIDVKPRELSRSDYTPEQARREMETAKANKETVGSGKDDAWIHSKIVAKMLTDFNTPERKINVDVNNAVVTLRGTVDTQDQKQEAERVARETDGVKQVNNMLRVKGRVS